MTQHHSSSRAGSRASSRLSRRTVTRGAAWAAPVGIVAAAAPAYATSGCIVATRFDDLTPGTRPTTLTFPPSSTTATIAFASSGNGGDPTPGRTGVVAATSTNPSWNYLEVEMLRTLSKGDSVTVTITFSQPVSNLAFRIHDIDTDTDVHTQGAEVLWVDHVVVNTGGYTFTRGSDVIGAGSVQEPFRNAKVQDQAIDSGRNHVDLRWQGPVSVVQFTYLAGSDGSSGNQHIGIGNLSFDDCG